MSGAAAVAGVASAGVQAVGAIGSGRAAADAARANAITAASQAETASRISTINADTITAQAEYNAAEIERRTEFNAGQIDRQVDDARTDLVLRLGQQRLRGEFLIGDQRARVGASGVTFEGSPLEVLAFQAEQNAVEEFALRTQGNAAIRDLIAGAEATRTAGAADALGARIDAAGRALSTRATGQREAASYQSQVGIYTAQARSATTGSYFRAAGDILGGGAKYGEAAYAAVRRI